MALAFHKINATLVTDLAITTSNIDNMGITVAFFAFHHFIHPRCNSYQNQ
jgi:hypothetical protein